MRDICPVRDDAQPHIEENGRCVLCLAYVTETDEEKEERAKQKKLEIAYGRLALQKYARKKNERGDSSESVLDVLDFMDAFYPGFL